MAVDEDQRTCTVVLHDDKESKEAVLGGAKVLPTGCVARLSGPGAKKLCVVASRAFKNPLEISLHVSLAQRFNFENRTKATIQFLDDASAATATHVELFFRDQHLSRADMWRLMRAAEGKVIYQGQQLAYLGSTDTTVRTVYINGDEVECALVSHQQTKLIFRSGSARYTILIQITKEMLEYWRDGDLMYERLLLGYLPELFKRWDSLKVRHQVSVVLFGRSDEQAAQSDFFRVVAADMPSAQWPELLRKIKRAFNDVTLPRQVSLAAKGNMLEAIHMAAVDFVDAKIDPHLASTGTSVIAVTAGTGLFETSYERLRKTTLMLMGNSIGVDIVALSPNPLHPVPLFCYEYEGDSEYALPHWVDISFWDDPQPKLTSRWLTPETPDCINDIALGAINITLADKQAPPEVLMHQYDNVTFDAPYPTAELKHATNIKTKEPSVGSADTLKAEARVSHSRSGSAKGLHATPDLSKSDRRASSSSSITRAKRDSLPPHPLLQTTRKISLGPRGLAPSRGVASTTVSVEHAQQGKDVLPVFSPDETSSGLAKQIRQSLIRKGSEHSLTVVQSIDSDSLSKPINIGTGLVVEHEEAGDPSSILEKKIMETVPEDMLADDARLSSTPNAKHNTFLNLARAAEPDDKPTKSPWVTLLNPCNPGRGNMRVASQYRKWQHVFPKEVRPGTFKWTSMCSPAALPLTTEYRASMRELEDNATKKVRRILVPPTDGSSNDTADHLLSQLVALRLMHGFQMPLMNSKPARISLDQSNERVLLSIGSLYHELHCLSAAEIQVVEYDAHAVEQEDDDAEGIARSGYHTRIASLLGGRTSIEVPFAATHLNLDWSDLDAQIVSRGEKTSDTGTSKMRFVLVPVDQFRAGAFPHHTSRDLTEEEIRTDGIQKLTQLWQRQRHFTDEDQRRQAALVRPKVAKGAPDRDPNPLAIEYQTRDPSAVVNAQGPLLTGQPYGGEHPPPLFAESEMYHSSTFDVTKLVKQMQEPPPHGVEVRDRRWFTRQHLRCFRGDEMVNWLLRVFKDLQSREDAVAIGNELMHRGIFSHVRHKHEFRDGNYFYQIVSAHRTVDYPDTASMFSKGPLRSVPSTPLVEARRSPMMRPAQSDSDSTGKKTPKQTPVLAPADRKQIMLSQMMQYNVDLAGKSEQQEIVDLHYDRIHNPENCYHIQLEWTNTTAKLIRDAINRWAALVDGYGLRLVQVPIAELSKLHKQHPFDMPMSIRLAVRPPDKIPPALQHDLLSSISRSSEDSLAYQKAILRKMDFVLDYEAAASFTTKVDVSYSFGRPDYELTQFVHKSGVLLAQISGDDHSDFLLLHNRLAVARPSLTGKISGEQETPEGLTQRFKAFCRDEAGLRAFYEETMMSRMAAPSPFIPATPIADFDVPPMQLPPHVLHRVAMKGIQ